MELEKGTGGILGSPLVEDLKNRLDNTSCRGFRCLDIAVQLMVEEDFLKPLPSHMSMTEHLLHVLFLGGVKP